MSKVAETFTLMELAMTVERGPGLIAGRFILPSLVLGAPHGPLRLGVGWRGLAAAVGLNSLPSRLRGFHPTGTRICKRVLTDEGGR